MSRHLPSLFVKRMYLWKRSLAHSLPQCILTSDLTVIEELAKVCVDHHASLASTLIQIFCHNQWVLPVIIKCLAGAIDVEGHTITINVPSLQHQTIYSNYQLYCLLTDNVSTLFRASTLATMLMDQYMKLTANDYLLAVVRPRVQAVVASVESCEVSVQMSKKISHKLINSYFHLHVRHYEFCICQYAAKSS